MRAVRLGVELSITCSSPTSASTVVHLLVVDAEIGGDDARVGLHEGRIAVGDLAAIFEHHDVVGNLHDHRHVVLDQQDRRAGGVLDVVEQRVERQRFPRIEAGRRLVEAQQFRPGAHGARDLQPALRAIGQVAGRVVGAVDQLRLFQPELRQLDRLGCGLR